MCGIFGYIGHQKALQIAIAGLKRLEYRGYDSAGIAGVKKGELVYCKEVGRVALLEQKVSTLPEDLNVVIAHTRWATHGKPSQENAHPHVDAAGTVAVVHNGIIENHKALRQQLKSEGVAFTSDTDSEVVAHLVARYYEGDLLKAVRRAVASLQGAYALAVVHRDFPDRIIAVAHESPLAIGVGEGEHFISSDANAFFEKTRSVLFLTGGEIAVVKADQFALYNAAMDPIKREPVLLNDEGSERASKGGFAHYTLKEIFDQPQAVRNAFIGRISEEFGTVHFDSLADHLEELRGVERILILACGTSWHAGYLATYLLEELAHLPAQVEISSEFRYKNPVVPHGTLVIAISQSGETADTLAAVRELKAKGAVIFAICNVSASALVREADQTLLLRAGPEIGVCSTKAFTNQLVTLFLFSLMMARMRTMDRQEGQRLLAAVKQLPSQIEQILASVKEIQREAALYSRYENFFFIGRHYQFPASLEGALKLKEISYINANGYPAGELKHGPIALINEACPTVAFCANQVTFNKLLSNLMEIRARSGKIIAIAAKSQCDSLESIADGIISVPDALDPLAPILSSVAAQLFAYYVALERGADIDQPRNLAKSVTVE